LSEPAVAADGPPFLLKRRKWRILKRFRIVLKFLLHNVKKIKDPHSNYFFQED